MGAKPVETAMDPSVKLCVDQGELLSSLDGYRRLVGKLNYLTITRPGISFAISVISQFMFAPRSTHMEATLRIVRYLKAHHVMVCSMECMAIYMPRHSPILIGLGLVQRGGLLQDTVLF